MRRTLLALGVSASLSSCAIRSDNTSSTKIINGRDASQQFPAVVLYYMNSPEGEGDCTGTFVSDTTMLTAAHCVADVVKADDVFLPSTNVKATDFLVHPNFKMSEITASMPFDMAVIKFPAETAPATVGFAKHVPKVGDQFTIVGYGQTDLKVGGKGAGKKRSATNHIGRIMAGLIMYAGDFESTNTRGERGASSFGDSGGPLLINDGIAGTCAGEFTRSKSEFIDTYTSVFSSAYRSFLKEATQKGFDIPGVENLTQVTTEADFEVSSITINALITAQKQGGI